MKVVITGGGTGGHIYPALSIARQLREEGAELLFVGSQHGPEGELARKDGLEFIAVPSGPIAGMSLRTARSFVKLGMGILKAHSILRQFAPDVVVGTGGYTSAGVAFAERLRGGNVVIHEQNSVPGKTNLSLAKFARKVCVTFDESAQFFPSEKTVVTGLPVRPDIITGKDRIAARESFGLDRDKFTVLVFGGSQGARKINEMVVDMAPKLIDAGLQVIHQTGSKNYESVMANRPDLPGYVVRPYIDDMAAAYSAADLVVSRSGASSIAEITVCGLPAVYIPYPFAHANHQLRNGEAAARAGAAMVVEEKDLSADVLSALVLDLVEDSARLKSMAEASKKFGRPDAAAHIARIVTEVAEGHAKR